MMTAPAAIAASLVNMRNVGTHKAVALTVHVPEEQAQAVIAAFGWPTMTAPVPVALARLSETSGSLPDQDGEVSPLDLPRAWTAASPSAPSEERRPWAELRPSTQAAIRCGEETFRKYLFERGYVQDISNVGAAAEAVRFLCGVNSRKELDIDFHRRQLWSSLDTGYLQATGRMAVAHG